MPFEIERKFLVSGIFQPFAIGSDLIRQAYLSTDKDRTVRIRQKAGKAYLTIKGKTNENGFSRIEWEHEITVADAELLFSLCEPDGFIQKKRYYVPCGKFMYEVDEFRGSNAGLVIAELELAKEDDVFDKPGWLGKEVTGDIRYYNSYLSQHPYSSW